MDSIKPIIIKLFVLLLILVGMNYLYKIFFFEKDLQKHSDIINNIRAVKDNKCEVVYLGESSNFTTRDDDNDLRPISSFISDYFPSIKFGVIDHAATHAGIYYEYLRNIPTDSNVKTVIVTLNLRSFDANWIYSNLETPLQKSIVLLKNYPPLFNRLMLSFRGYDVKTNEERDEQLYYRWSHDKIVFPFSFEYYNTTCWDKAMATKGIRNPDNSINYPLTELACHYVKTYSFQINTKTNPRIEDFDRIVSLAKKRGWNLVFNLMAENVERAQELVGEELVFLIRQNRDLLVNRYQRDGVIVVDNLECVPGKYYIDRNWTTEHYAEVGRKIIARNVANRLKQLYPSEYNYVDYYVDETDQFINDCEGNTIWGQMGSLSGEKSFSGKKSSKTGDNQQFSITFQRNINSLPDSLHKVSVRFQLFQEQLSDDVKLVFEISGQFINYCWNGYSLKEITSITGKWTDVDFSYRLPENFYKGDIIKIYVYNPSSGCVYVDNVDIHFGK